MYKGAAVVEQDRKRTIIAHNNGVDISEPVSGSREVTNLSFASSFAFIIIYYHFSLCLYDWAYHGVYVAYTEP